ncbi:ceramidase domain-containing protein [Pseudodonghicola flavimaris]|uniref:Ceramidase domain-containing protein n=1 Tax=Pseudodonghicola flavimaris TaxID=3050036 RepID=A0ABT7F0N1_9RHOB|nr:ceramidase domain-containing protein [Pseudodonghicola flavimaris]MDK3018147.1 ceramidase domain-containing protein [Pseudodonghicola flavimaris]
MRLTDPVDSYCERLDPGYWAEPVNALTNLAFLLAAAVMAARLRRQPVPLGRAQAGMLAVVGLGSYLFHTHAQVWAGIADMLPILGFILLYLYAVNRHVWGIGRWGALALTALFLPYAALLAPVFGRLGMGSSAGYAPVPLLILLYALAIRHRAPAIARGWALGAGVLIVSLGFRMLDQPLCGLWPLGTHPMWHLLNAAMLGWMIEVYRRALIPGAARQG